jgi:hypothetical protein
MVVAVERDPVRAARFHELEAVADEGLDPEAGCAAISEIGRIVDAARAE